MIVLVSKYNPATGEVENTRRDLSAAECEDLIHEYRPGTEISCTTLSYDPELPEHGSYKIRAAAKCQRRDPIVLKVQGSVKYAFRGTVVCCGVGPDGEDTNIKTNFLANKYPIEPAYKEDTICIPSLAEWLQIPQRTREILTADLWCWSRDIRAGQAKVISTLGYHSDYSINSNNGGVVSFVDLRRLPSDVADKIRASKMRLTHPDTGEVLENTVCFENTSPLPFTMVKITEDVYGIRAGRRNKILGRSTDLERIDGDITKTYEESWLRAYLNSDYLEQLIKYIREH